MKKEALTSTETTGPADQINKLVQEYLRNPSTVVDVSKVKVEKEEVKQCEVICLDDDDKVKNKTEENAIKSKKRGRPPRSGTSKIAKPAKGTIKATVKTKGKLQKPRRRKGMVRKTTTLRDKWSQENKVDLVRRMRKEYDALLKSNELVNGYSPWRRVIQNIHKKYYSTYKLEKLLTVWCQMKLSATIHEKNGCDIVDDEVWDMLQIQNAVHKSVANKNSNGATANKVNLREKSKAAVSEKDGDELNQQTFDLQTRKTYPGTRKIPDVPVPPKPVESQKHIWTNEEKLQLLEEGCRQGGRESLRSPNTTVMAMWSQMRRNASINESEGRMSITDQKILRLQRLYNRVRKGYSPPTKKQEKVQDVKWEAKTLKEERIPKVTLVKKQQTSKKDEDNSKETDEECTNIKRLKTSHQEKLDIFEAIKKCGPKVFKKDNLMKREYWSQVLNEVNAKGHKWSSGKLRNNWQYMLNKAKQAWAGQREPGDIDKLIIDFMTEVIQSKAKTDLGESTNTEHRDETDDKFDEVSERMSEPISNGDPVSNNTEDVKNTLPDYDYVSLEDIEKGLVENDETTNTVQIKKELVEVKQENEFPFKIESYTSEEVVEILDSDDDQKL
ncbi:hypothetical protein NQ317_013500 [Molorchus minor]|uniref:Regulatory protein zeste n=1 Tax=Molorchus minor TaxID=1323400 RepID=A0ABQ9JVX0_9CUCU|nr:hypothetical protein NQ317_013500 [Molorchus minor]